MENNEELDFDLDELIAMLSEDRDEHKDEIAMPALQIEERPEPVQEPERIPEQPAQPVPEKSASRERQAKDKARSWQKTLLMYLHDLIYLLGGLMIVSLLLVRIVVVSGTSMNKTLLDGDYLFVLSNTIYHQPKNGDIVVVSKQSFDNGKPIVKRVIATEGQWVNIEDGIVYVGDSLEEMEPLDEDYTTTATATGSGFTYPLQVEEGCIFCLGDNRAVSHDSRSSDIGMIDTNEVLGKVLFLFMPGSNKDAFGHAVESPDFGRIGVVD